MFGSAFIGIPLAIDWAGSVPDDYTPGGRVGQSVLSEAWGLALLAYSLWLLGGGQAVRGTAFARLFHGLSTRAVAEGVGRAGSA